MRARGCCSGIDYALRILGVESGKIEKSRNAVHVQSGHLVRAACEADSNHSGSREPLIILPSRKRKAGEQVVLAENDVRNSVSCSIDRTLNSYDAFCRQSELREISANVLGHKLVTPHAESAERRIYLAHDNIVGTYADWDKS